MYNSEFVSAALYGAVGALFFALGLPLALGKIPPNHWYGFRTTKTLASSQTWYAANQVAGQDLMIAGVVLLLGVIGMTALKVFVSPALPLRSWGLVLFCVVGIAVVAHSFRSLARL